MVKAEGVAVVAHNRTSLITGLMPGLPQRWNTTPVIYRQAQRVLQKCHVLLDHDNMGPARIRNRLLEYPIETPYIWFLDDDDEMVEPEILFHRLPVADVIYFDYLVQTNYSISRVHLHHDPLVSAAIGVITCCFLIGIGTCRKVIADNGQPLWDETRPCLLDSWLWLKLLQVPGLTFGYIPRVGYQWNRKTSVVSRHPEMQTQRREYITKVQQIAEAQQNANALRICSRTLNRISV